MKQIIALLVSLLLTGIFTHAQKEFKKSLTGITRVEIEAETAVRIVKGASNEIIMRDGCTDCDGQEYAININENKDTGEEDARAKGLKAIYPGGVDNTGIGIIVQQEGEVLKVKDLKGYLKRGGLTITLPSSVSLNLNCGNMGSATVDGWSSELEIKTSMGQIKLKNVTGPVTASSSTGNIEADFSAVNQDAPTSIISSTGAIDISLPEKTNASVELRSTIGSVYSNFDLVKPREDGLKPLNGHKAIAGNLNNGGVKISLKASTGNIYLRKK